MNHQAFCMEAPLEAAVWWYKKTMTGRRSAAVLFLALLALGVVWPALAGTVRCGDCCGHASPKRSNPCGIPATGFSLCCFGVRS